MIPGSSSAQFFGAAGAASGGGGAYEISRSLRFNSSDSAYLSRTFASAGNRRTFTLAFWFKRSNLQLSNRRIFGIDGTADTFQFSLMFDSADKLYLFAETTSTNVGFTTNAVLRDPSSWYHFVIAADTTQATDTDRLKCYINGSLASLSATYPALNSQFYWNTAREHYVGRNQSGFYIDGYYADIHHIDGQALTPSSFTEVSATTGQLIPKAYSGSFGTNGFWLKFSDNSAATATTLGKDYSGNSNNWTPNNLAVGGAQPALYSSPNLYTDAADVIANGTPLSSGSTFSNVYVYLVTNGGGDVGSKVFTADGSGTIGTNWTWLHRIGASWTSSGGYNDSEWDLFTWGSQTVATNYIMNNSAPLHMLVSSAGSPQQVSGTIATFNSTPNSGAGNDSLVDTPTSYGTDDGLGGSVRGNYCTLNPLDNGGALVLTNGNLDAENTTADHDGCRCTIKLPSSGKWYYEGTVLSPFSGTTANMLGVATGVSANPGLGASGTYYILVNASGAVQRYIAGSSTSYTGFSTPSIGSVLQVAYDADNGKLWLGLNNLWMDGSSGATGSPSTGANPTVSSVYDVFPSTSQYSTKIAINFGQRPFAYTAPSGFKALCTTNLPEPTIADGSTVMDVALYTGNGSTQTISGLGFSPDFVWLKGRSDPDKHGLYDIVRGATKILKSDSTDAEDTQNGVTAFNSDGFNIGNYAESNGTSRTYVAWTWDAGSSTVPNNDGSITSQVRANPSAGFSIVTYTGTGSSATLGHGLGVAPSFIIVKCRSDGNTDWPVYHASLGASNRIYLSGTPAASAGTNWNSTSPTSSVFSVGDNPDTNGSSRTYVAYCFAPVAGYSAFGSYTGNGSTDGPFIYTGFRPRYLLLKQTNTTRDWLVYDSARDDYNAAYKFLYPNLSNAEGTNPATLPIDFLSNGLKLRSDNVTANQSAGTYIYAAFAESPFQYARAR